MPFLEEIKGPNHLLVEGTIYDIDLEFLNNLWLYITKTTYTHIQVNVRYETLLQPSEIRDFFNDFFKDIKAPSLKIKHKFGIYSEFVTVYIKKVP